MHSKDEFHRKISKIIEFLKNTALDIQNTEIDNLAKITNLKEIICDLEVLVEKIKMSELKITIYNPNTTLNITNRQEYRAKLSSLQIQPISATTKQIENCLNYIREKIIEDFILPFNEAPPLIELFVFDDTISVKRQVVGAPRAAIQKASVDPNFYLLCECCQLDDVSKIVSTLPDICIAYKLHLEYGKMINLYDWLQAFRCIVEPDADDEDDINPKIQYVLVCVFIIFQ